MGSLIYIRIIILDEASLLSLEWLDSRLCLFGWLVGWLVSERPLQQLGYIADGPQDRASDNLTYCHT